MSCSLEEHKKTAKAKLDEIFHETGTIKVEGNIVTITPSPLSDKIKTIEAASKTADGLIKKANDWGGNKYGKPFLDGWAIKSKSDSDSNKIVIKLHFPQMLEYAINKKKGQDDFKEKYTRESHIKSDIFNGRVEVKSSDIIRNIGKSTHLLSTLANSLKRFALLNDVKIILEDKHHYNIKDGHVVEEKTGNSGPGYYDEKTNTIYIAERNEFKNTNIETVLLHEIIHSIANYKLNDKNSDVAKDFSILYEHAIKYLNKDKFYGLTNPKEFLVALFTDKKLINAVKEIKPTKDVKEYKNLLQEIGDWIMKILKIPRTNSLYEQAFSVATNVINEQAETSENELERIKYESSLVDENYTSASKSDEEKKYSDYKVAGKMPFQDSTIEKLKSGEQKVTIRTANYPSGNYTIGNDTFNIINIGRKNIKDFENPNELRNSFKGNEIIKQKHIQDFFTGKQNLFVYQVTKINETNKDELSTQQSSVKIKDTEEAKRSKPQSEIEFERQYTLLKRKLNRLEKEVSLATPGTSEYDELKAEFNAQKVKLEEAVDKESKEGYVELGNEQLNWVEDVIKNLPLTPTTKIIQNITDAFEIINAFPTSELSDLGGRSEKLREELFPYIVKHGLEKINEFSKQGEVVTEDDINNDDKDIRWSSKSMGSLSDVNNHIGSTIGILIKNRQNAASSLNHKLEKTVQEKVDKLSAWAKSNNMSLQDAYDLLIQENKTGTLILAQKYHSDGSENKNYEKIMNTPELKEFYDFYQKVIETSEANLPYKVGRGYILNKKKDNEGLKGTLKNLVPVKSMLFDSFVSNQQLIADSVPDMYRQAIPAKEKSRDLGSGLLQFAAYANNHNELSKVLPEVRLLQEMLKYKRTKAGNIVSKTYKKSSNPKESVYAEDSNIFKMVDTVIDMQLKGRMKNNTWTPINIKKIKDGEGNVIGYKQVHIEDILDKGLRYNSLLRIGFSPITALSNVVFGDISNLIEAVGGRYFNNTELAKATKIFSQQTDYISNKKESNLYTWINKLNPLQEFGDYDIGENLQAEPKKLTKEKALELMYSLQKKGEFYLQSRTMIAMLIHDGYMNTDGTNTEKGDKMSESELSKFSDKVQRVNQMVHGRYSQREAATLQQQAWYRAAIQFRKWIPAYVESRFGDKKFDRRLMSDVEGRYRTFGNKVFKAESVSDAFANLFLPLLNSKKALERGNMTDVEIYNMRKNLVEMIMLSACTLMIAGLKSGSDDDKKKKLKNPFIKAGLTMLNRASGDLAFFYNPQNATKMGKNAIPMMKLLDDVMTVGMTLPHALYLGDYKIKKGSLKGYNDFWAKNVEKIIPGLAPGGQIQRIANSTDILPELN